ncbi:hypothetical protein K445DRAFT_384254 [Daldinia sp. EC12]|nr:hypothetical protein K445DRAFT_384254 [Daldinia sp. EC12]
MSQDAPFLFLYTLHGHHLDEQFFAHSAGQGCVMCCDFPFHDDKSQRSEVRKFGFFTIFWVSYDEGVPHMTVDSGRGWKTVSSVKGKDSTDSLPTWTMISEWMETCLQGHSLCNKKSGSENYMPTRLSKINYSHSSGPYVALSYRWGVKPLDKTHQLLNSTSAWLDKPNPIKHLPKTLRDAVHVVYRFGIQYLWIDRLCIYQDSCEDWRKEAGTMQDVYRNALFCISALGAEDDEGGCFFERLMAPRTIYFGKRQVFWECAELHACETQPKGFGGFSPACNSFGTEKHENRDDIDYPLSKQLIAVPTAPCATRDSLTRILADWSSIVSLYSNTRLTLPRDKLVAVSGLAKDTRKALQYLKPRKHRYLAGIWEGHLIETLCWYVRVGTAATRATCYRAPSWFWDSLGGNLIIPDTFVEEVVEISTIICDDVEFIGADDTGEVASGRLVLRGPVCSVDTHVISSIQYACQSTVIFDTSDDFCEEFVCIWTMAQPTVLGGWQVSSLALGSLEDNTFLRVGIVSSYYTSQADL